jgi:PIN domain nuclease of toxin-antitoxin system
MPEQPLLLDTHTWLWWQSGSQTLNPDVVGTLNRSAMAGELSISIISIWETAMLSEKGRITLTLPCQEWVELALQRSGVSLTALSPTIVIASCQLPGSFHADPADRFLVATARCLGLVLATRDERILEYGRQGHVAVMSV